jgi:hypothetical protein
MNFRTLYRLCVVCAGTLGLLVLATQVHAQESRTGTIKSVVGSVMVVRDGSSLSARPGDPVGERDRIATGPNSATAFTLRDGTSILVGSNSALDLTSFQYEPTRQDGSMVIGLLSGSMRFITGLLGRRNADRIRISSPTMTIGIRGTDFILEAE